MFSQRFGRPVVLTLHARRRMAERSIGEDILLKLIERGTVRHKDERRLWIAGHFPDRQDNLLCIAVVLEEAVVIKTVMHHFVWEPQA